MCLREVLLFGMQGTIYKMNKCYFIYLYEHMHKVLV
jgi:hypothetical protein